MHQYHKFRQFLLMFLGGGKFDCTFENGDLCSWKNSAGAVFNWTLQNGKTSSVNTGPSEDHTLKNGMLLCLYHIVINERVWNCSQFHSCTFLKFPIGSLKGSNEPRLMKCISFVSSDNGTYIYAEASSPRQRGDKAVLVSSKIPANSRPGDCISFWYHMFGAHVGTLNFYIQTGSGVLPNPTWTRTGTQGNEWRKAMVFYPSTLQYKVNNLAMLWGIR